MRTPIACRNNGLSFANMSSHVVAGRPLKRQSSTTHGPRLTHERCFSRATRLLVVMVVVVMQRFAPGWGGRCVDALSGIRRPLNFFSTRQSFSGASTPAVLLASPCLTMPSCANCCFLRPRRSGLVVISPLCPTTCLYLHKQKVFTAKPDAPQNPAHSPPALHIRTPPVDTVPALAKSALALALHRLFTSMSINIVHYTNTQTAKPSARLPC